MLCLVTLGAACTDDGDRTEPGISDSPRVRLGRAECSELDELITRTRRGYVPVRSPDVLPIPREPHYIGKAELPVHTGPWDYLAEVPLVFHGPGVVDRAQNDRPVTLADLAPTLAEGIGFDDFEAPDGEPLPVAFLEVPKIVVTIVWDGGGWNTLREHERSWPFLESAMRNGTSFPAATIGSTPSNTPPIHTTIGTGAFPVRHGIPHTKIRSPEGGYVDPFEGDDASLVRVPTLGDLYDRSRDNRPQVGLVATVNWHLGMIGHGAMHPGGDRDVALLLDDRGLTYGNAAIYDVANYADGAELGAATERLDGSDGERDQRWGSAPLTDPAIRYGSPAFTAYQQSVLETTIREEGFGQDEVPDLMYVNFKQIDDAGHRWGMTSPEVGANVQAADSALRRLSRFLDASVGAGEWLIVVTADHGQTLYPHESGGWPIRGSELNADIEAAFGDAGIDVLRVTSGGIFLQNPSELNEDKAAALGRWLTEYKIADNVAEGEELPVRWRKDAGAPLFSAALVGRKVAATLC